MTQIQSTNEALLNLMCLMISAQTTQSAQSFLQINTIIRLLVNITDAQSFPFNYSPEKNFMNHFKNIFSLEQSKLSDEIKSALNDCHYLGPFQKENQTFLLISINCSSEKTIKTIDKLIFDAPKLGKRIHLTETEYQNIQQDLTKVNQNEQKFLKVCTYPIDTTLARRIHLLKRLKKDMIPRFPNSLLISDPFYNEEHPFTLISYSQSIESSVIKYLEESKVLKKIIDKEEFDFLSTYPPIPVIPKKPIITPEKYYVMARIPPYYTHAHNFITYLEKFFPFFKAQVKGPFYNGEEELVIMICVDWKFRTALNAEIHQSIYRHAVEMTKEQFDREEIVKSEPLFHPMDKKFSLKIYLDDKYDEDQQCDEIIKLQTVLINKYGDHAEIMANADDYDKIYLNITKDGYWWATWFFKTIYDTNVDFIVEEQFF